MDRIESDLVNLYETQVGQTDVASVHLRTTQEDTRMLEPELVDRIRELSGQGQVVQRRDDREKPNQ